MRKWMSGVAVWSAVMLGCGSDSDAKDEGKDNLTSDAGQISANEDAGASSACTGEDTPAVIPGYMGTQPTFSREDLKACQTKCQGMDVACFSEMNCPGIDAWSNCAFENVLACVGSEGKSCREELVAVECCAAASGCDLETDDGTCVQNKCGTEIGDFRKCMDADTSCNMTAPVSCFGASVPAMPAMMSATTSSLSESVVNALRFKVEAR